MQFDDFILEQAQGPFGVPLRGWSTCQRDQFCFRHAVENPWPGRVRVIFAGQHGFKPFLDQLPPGAKDVGDAGIQRLSDPAVVQPSPSSDTSAFNRMRAFVNNWAERLPLRTRSLSSARSSALNRTTYFLTAIS